MMRSVLLLLLAAMPAFADSECTVDYDRDDLVSRGKDVTVEAGQHFKNVFVIDGAVRLKKGARVKSVIVSNGDVTVDEGANVAENVISIGGQVHLARKSDVKKGVIALDHGLHVSSDDGGKAFDLDLRVDGLSLADRVAVELAKKLRDCRLVAK